MANTCPKHPWREKVPGVDRCALCFERPKALAMDVKYTIADWARESEYSVGEGDLVKLREEVGELVSWAFGKGAEAGVEYARRG